MDDQSFFFIRLVFAAVFTILGLIGVAFIAIAPSLLVSLVGGLVVVGAVLALYDVATFDSRFPNG